LLSREESVSTEARIVALKQLAALLDALVALEHAVLAHAATDGTNPTP
jgi:argininosuccinate lyase